MLLLPVGWELRGHSWPGGPGSALSPAVASASQADALQWVLTGCSGRRRGQGQPSDLHGSDGLRGRRRCWKEALTQPCSWVLALELAGELRAGLPVPAAAERGFGCAHGASPVPPRSSSLPCCCSPARLLSPSRSKEWVKGKQGCKPGFLAIQKGPDLPYFLRENQDGEKGTDGEASAWRSIHAPMFSALLNQGHHREEKGTGTEPAQATEPWHLGGGKSVPGAPLGAQPLLPPGGFRKDSTESPALRPGATRDV